MKKIALSGVAAGLCLCFTTLSLSVIAQQQGSPTKEWQVSGEVPLEITLQNVLNYKSSTLSFKDYQGKLVILDYWNTYCGSCIKAWPKLDSLQQEYGERILILLVTTEPAEKVKTFVAQRSKAMNLKLSMPIVTDDTLLHQLNPTRYNPYYVWIEPGGQVIGKTNTYMMTKENVAVTLQQIEAYRPKRLKQYEAKQAARKKIAAKQKSEAPH